MTTMFSVMFAFLFAVTFVSHQTFGAVYITDHSQRKVIEFRERAKPCNIYTQSEVVKKYINNPDIRNFHRMSLNELDSIGISCQNVEQMNRKGGFIYPGTKWCGPANIASSYNDLGSLSEEDKCCREHDHCPNILEPGQCRQGICNVSPFTRSHCECDIAFKRCLREVNSDSANTIGNLYFNIVQVTCFKDRRSCPQHMREDPSYTWFCEEWKFEPSEEFNTSLLTRHEPIVKPIENIPEKPIDFIHKPHASNIDKNLQNLFEKDPNAGKVMMNKVDVIDKQPPSKSSPTLLNSIVNGNQIWRN